MTCRIYKVDVTNRNMQFNMQTGQTLLAGMEKSTCRAIDVGCRGGGCGLCKVKVLSGVFTTKCMSRRHISEQQQAEGYALACRLLPESDLVLESDHFIQCQ